MGANNGTGHPNWLRCWACRRRRDEHVSGALEATGRTKPRRKTGGARTTNRQIEYRCLDCGFIGWTIHVDAERLLRRLESNETE